MRPALRVLLPLATHLLQAVRHGNSWFRSGGLLDFWVFLAGGDATPFFFLFLSSNLGEELSAAALGV